jgi:hypothetical protein
MPRKIGQFPPEDYDIAIRRAMFAVIAMVAAILVMLCVGCTRFEVETGHGITVKSSGAPLVSRQSSFLVTHQWLDEETNTLHEVRVSQALDENASAQLRALEMAFKAGKAAAVPAP